MTHERIRDGVTPKNTISPLRSPDHHAVPMLDHIRDMRRRGIAPYLSIGHRLGAAADPEIVELIGKDLFESNTYISAAAYLSHLELAERLAADAWGADHAHFLVDGSSAGNHAALMALLQPGDDVIISRDLHWSLLVAIILTGAKPIYVNPRLDLAHDIGVGVDAATVEAALRDHPAAKLVAIVSPSWSGVATDLTAIADVAHARGIPLYVDEAWGPHYHFHPELPQSAMASGADVAVTSVHKILPAVSQGSLLLSRGELIDHERLSVAVRMMSTTSPMMPIYATLDATRRQMALHGRQRLQETVRLARAARERIQAIAGLSVLSARILGLPEQRYDPTKFVIDVHRLGITGFDVEQRLNDEFAIAVESSDWRGIVANFNLGDTETSSRRFVTALEAIAAGHEVQPEETSTVRSTGNVLTVAEQAITPREAYFSSKRSIPLRLAAGEVAADLVTPYPPGIPVLAPGEVITQERIDYLIGVYERGAVDYGRDRGNRERQILVVDRRPRR